MLLGETVKPFPLSYQASSSFTFNPNDLYLIVLFEFIGNILAGRFF